jgi:hypothetical protein
MVGLLGTNVKLVVGGCGAPIVSVFELDAVLAGEEESVAVSLIVKEPAAV